jgi:hypothetical protein
MVYFMQEFGWEVLHHLDPRDYYQLFAPMKTFLVGHQFKPDFEVLETTRVIQFFHKGINKLVCWWDVAGYRVILWRSDFSAEYTPMYDLREIHL